ncbi:MAG TPA: ABC transporter ATP-binding protein [Gemmatimonadales bacterium]|nr:ABC transporter ATP-binding protein [Gemmatimonadales bacterium]
MILEARDATVRYPGMGLPALDGVELVLAAGELVAVVGPNGGGKTTLVRAILGLVPLLRGAVTLDGRPLAAWRRGELAQFAALVPQREESPFSWRVEEMVAFGRYARLGALSPMSRADHAAVDRALERCDVTALRARRVETLSGGEWQRVRIARALAQEPRLLVLDEPTVSLDLGHEMTLFELIRGLVRGGVAGLVVTHHLNLAARYADRLLLIEAGRLVATGPPDAVMRSDLLSRVFDWPVEVVPLGEGAMQIVPRRPPADPRDYP